MKLSEERISHISHLIFDNLYFDDVVDFEDEDDGVREIKRAVTDFVRSYEEIDQYVRGKVTSLKRKVHEGSDEWEILYRKYFEEEIRKRKMR